MAQRAAGRPERGRSALQVHQPFSGTLKTLQMNYLNLWF